MSFRPIFYDTETTGIKAGVDRVIELAAYDPVNDKQFHQLINPCCPIPQEASNIHHITDAMVADKPIFAAVTQAFLDFCSGNVVLIAHNNDSFDIHFLRHEFKTAGMEMPAAWKFFDTLKWARRYRPDLPRHSLQYLREVYGFPANNAHRALDDVIILHQVYQKMVDDIPIEKALELLNKPRVIQHMPFGKHQGTLLANMPKSYVAWLKDNGALDKPENQELKQQFETLGLLTV